MPRRPSYAADEVFLELGREILLGVLAPGSSLPPERALSERFGVSKLLVRQGIHRLAAAGLLHVRQGHVTRVLDPTRASSLDVIELHYRLAPRSTGSRVLAQHVLEKQFTQGLSLVEIFARRATPAARVELDEMVRSFRGSFANEAALDAAEQRFWRAVARGAGNRILEAETSWWYDVLPERPKRADLPPVAARAAFYAELGRRLVTGDAPLAYYAGALGPSISALFTDAKASARASTKRSRS